MMTTRPIEERVRRLRERVSKEQFERLTMSNGDDPAPWTTDPLFSRSASPQIWGTSGRALGALTPVEAMPFTGSDVMLAIQSALLDIRVSACGKCFCRKILFGIPTLC